MKDAARRLTHWAGAHPLAAAEVGLALALGVFVWSVPPLRAIVAAVLFALAAGLRSWFGLLADDAGGTIVIAAAALVELALVVAPAARMYASARRHRLAWLPLHATIAVLALPMLFPAFSTWTMRVLLVLGAAGGWFAARRPRLALLALVPQLLVLEPMLGHSPLSDLVWTRGRLASRCDGRPVARGFPPELANARYYAVTAAGRDLFLVTGERFSFWLRRAGGSFSFAGLSDARGNLWEGCPIGDSLFLVKRGFFVRVRPPQGGAAEQVVVTPLDDPPETRELDLIDAVCDADAGAVYVTELLGGGVRRIRLADGAASRLRGPGGLNVQLLRRSDGLLVGIDTARLFVYDPSADRVVSERRAGLSALGIDLCRVDDGVVVTDLAGRVRLFDRDGDGYRFERGALMAAPRRVAFSPDCGHVAVASADDETVSILRRADLAVVQRFSAGPGLRDLVWADASHVLAADACGVEILSR
jgi:hypothetical protein